MDEQAKQALLVAILAFNIVIILFQVLLNGFPGIIIDEFDWLRLLGGIVLAAAVGGGIFLVMRRK
jgi:hypothetical protein